MKELIDILRKESEDVHMAPAQKQEIQTAISIMEKYKDKLIADNGVWTLNNMEEHVFDLELSIALTNYLKMMGVQTAVDFGCGHGKYTQALNRAGIATEGYDGNPYTPQLTNGTCKVQDLSRPFDTGKKYDCVLSLEVGEHIPKEMQDIYIDNICRHAGNLVVISWAVPGQGGWGHVNCQTNEYIREQFFARGFLGEMYMENIVRLTARNDWFKNTILIFKRKPKPATAK